MNFFKELLKANNHNKFIVFIRRINCIKRVLEFTYRVLMVQYALR